MASQAIAATASRGSLPVDLPAPAAGAYPLALEVMYHGGCERAGSQLIHEVIPLGAVTVK